MDFGGKKGFTLIEFLVTVAISVILAGAVLAYNQSARSRADLYVAEAGVGQAILRAKSLSVTTERKNLTVPCGYGVYFNYSASPAYYSLFDYSTSTPYSVTSAPPCDNIGSISLSDPGYTEQSSSTLPGNLSFGSGASRAGMIFFVPPGPSVTIWADDLQTKINAGYVYLQASDGASTATLTVNSAGQVVF